MFGSTNDDEMRGGIKDQQNLPPACRFTQLNGGRTIKALVPGHKGKLQLYLRQFVIVGTGITILPLSNFQPPWVMTKLAPMWVEIGWKGRNEQEVVLIILFHRDKLKNSTRH